MSFTWKRTLSTLSSERFVAQLDGQDAAAFDIHYLPNGQIAGTVILLRSRSWNEEQIQRLLRAFDEDFLPHANWESGGICFTVVLGEVLANFEAQKENAAS
ncbi:MAG: hypothetical protein NZM04_03730 [Methylacidiphilales bacterium]|nr:hypothetical protein [Candidatus Methylacidiphilales bacterium]MDW8348793.1 hypothetical protein [Verrucomicrobiae bacterium]